MLAALAALAVLLPQTPTPLPFETAGKELLAAADRARGKLPVAPGNVVARLAPLHCRVRLGALELWLPKKVLNDRLAARPGPELRDFTHLATDFVELERGWIERLPGSAEDRARAHEAADTLALWTATLVGSALPEMPEDTNTARVALERFFHRRELDERAPALVLIVAPTRAQLLGLLGAAATVEPSLAITLCRERQRRASSCQIKPGVMVLAQSSVGDGERASPTRNVALDPDELRQANLHAASHLLSAVLTPAAPAWWSEGIALCDTIETCGADETLCTGVADANPLAAVPTSGSPLEILLWVTRHKSPFRGGASRAHFIEVLAAALKPEGLSVLDLDRMEPAGRIPPALLGERAPLPTLVVAGTHGVKKGHAELYRAWSGGFMHWLSTQRRKDDTLLDALCRELARVPWEPERSRSALHEFCRQACGRTLGASDDPALDLEAAFAASLRR